MSLYTSVPCLPYSPISVVICCNCWWVAGRACARVNSINRSSTMVLFLVVATIPAGVAGLLLKDIVATELRTVQVIAVTTLVFALLLGFADRRSSVKATTTAALDWRSVCMIGLAQALAIVPGTSRSGITMTAALLCGLGREEAARFSFLLSIPIIAAAGLLQTLELSGASAPVDWTMIICGGLVSAVTAYLCVRWFLSLIGRIGFMPFVIYRLALGSVLVWIGW